MEERRGFFKKVLGILLGLMWGVPGGAALLDPLRRTRAATWRPAMALAELKEGEATAFAYEVRAGWETRKETLFLVRRGESVLALGSRCTHLGCRVRAREGEFRCPCHGGVFSAEGEPLAGPVREPLARHETRIVDGRVEVRA